MSRHLLLSQSTVRTCRLIPTVRHRTQPFRLQHIHREAAEARLPQRVSHITNAKSARDSGSQTKERKQKKSPQQVADAKPTVTHPEIVDDDESDLKEVYGDLQDFSNTEQGIMGFEEWMHEDRVPVTVITGFLGSGKTTLLNNLLTKGHGKRIAVIENEYGEIDIDSSLVSSKEFVPDSGQIMMLNNGCMCCTVKDDLVRMLTELIDRRDQFDQVVIETTGLADPQPIIATLRMSPNLQEDLVLDGVITLVDAKHIEQHLDEKKPEGALNEAADQIAYADRILLNKTDTVSEEQLNRVHNRIRAINSLAQIKRVQQADVPADYVLKIAGFEPALVGKELEPEHQHSADGHSHDHGHSHSHDDAVSSISIVLDGNVDADKVNDFLEELLGDNAETLYRYKGILSVDGVNSRSVFQGVHLDFSANFDREWKANEKRQSKMVFIGRNLDKDYIRKGFEACLV